MSFFDFLSGSYKVESLIGLVAFILSSVLGYLAYTSNNNMKRIAEIISLSNSKTKASLATTLLKAFPSYNIPDLSQNQGFKVVKMQMEQKSKEFEERIKLIKFGIIIFSLFVVFIFVNSLIEFKNHNTTNGADSDIIIGNGNTVSHGKESQADSLQTDSLLKSLKKTDTLSAP